MPLDVPYYSAQPVATVPTQAQMSSANPSSRSKEVAAWKSGDVGYFPTTNVYSSYIGGGVTDAGFNAAIDKLSGMAAENTATSARMAEQQMDFQKREREAVQAFNASEAQKVRDWQEQLAGSAHQREVRDLISAGLNPVLSALSGNGAQVPSGVSASSQAQSGAKGSVDTTATQGFVSLLGTMMSNLIQQENARLSAQTNLAIADKNNSMSQLLAQLNAGYRMDQINREGEYSLERQRREADAAAYRTMLSGEYGLKQAIYGADSAFDRLRYQLSHDEFMAQNFPSNLTQFVNAVIGALSSGGSQSGVGVLSGLFGNGSSNPFSALSDELLWERLSDAQRSRIDGAYKKNGRWYRPANWRSQVESWYR